jgi:sugar phosphate isomerase/epimerase
MKLRLAFVLACSLLFRNPARAEPDQAELDKLHWRLACQAYTFRAVSLLEMLDILKQLGVHYIEMYPGQNFSADAPDVKVLQNLSDENIERLKRKLREAGVEANSFGVVDLSSDEKAAREVFDFAKKLNLRTIVSEPPVEALPMLDKLTAEYAVKLAIHNHPKPKSLYWNCDTTCDALKNCSDRIGACADVGHWYRSELVPLECLRKLQGHIIELHFKDLSEQKLDVPWGTGKCDIRAMMEEIHRQKIPATFVIEYESTTGQELIDNVRKSIEYFNSVARELADKDHER